MDDPEQTLRPHAADLATTGAAAPGERGAAQEPPSRLRPCAQRGRRCSRHDEDLRPPVRRGRLHRGSHRVRRLRRRQRPLRAAVRHADRRRFSRAGAVRRAAAVHRQTQSGGQLPPSGQVPGGGQAPPGFGTPVSGTAATKAAKAAVAKYPGSVEAVMQLPDGSYVVHVITSSGEDHVAVSSAFQVTGVEQRGGFGGRGGVGGPDDNGGAPGATTSADTAQS